MLEFPIPHDARDDDGDRRPRFFLRGIVDLRAPIQPASFTHGDAIIFRAAGPGIGIGIGLLAELPALAPTPSR